MTDDFDCWNNKKKYLEAVDNLKINFAEREVWWCSLGKNIGDEENGKNDLFERPVLILKKFSRNSVVVILGEFITIKSKTSKLIF